MNLYLQSGFLLLVLATLPGCGSDSEHEDPWEPQNSSNSEAQPGSSQIETLKRDEQTEKGHQNLLILGDSIGAGFLSDTILGDFVGVELVGSAINIELSSQAQLTLELEQLFDFKKLTFKDKEIFAAFQELQESYRSSPSGFYGGTDLESDRSSLAYRLDLSTDHVRNLSIPGYQADEVLAAVKGISEDGWQSTDLIVLEVGSNDFCYSNDDKELIEQFETNYREIVNEITFRAPDSTVLVIPLPDIPFIVEQTSETSIFMVNLPFVGTYDFTCSHLQKHLCPRLFRNDVEDARELHKELNLIIESVVADSREVHSLDITLIESIADSESFDQHMLAIDCFHPGVEGHSVLSSETYKALSN